LGEETRLLDRVLGDKVICDVIHVKSILGCVEKMRRIVHRTGLSILAPLDSFLGGLEASVCLACVSCCSSEIRR